MQQLLVNNFFNVVTLDFEQTVFPHARTIYKTFSQPVVTKIEMATIFG